MKNVQDYHIINFGVCTSIDSVLAPVVPAYRISHLGNTVAEAYQDICSHVAGMGYSIASLPDCKEIERHCKLNREEKEKLNDPKYFAYLTLAVS